MRVTSEHAEFFRQRRAPMPKWASQFLPRSRVSIDTCIADHANLPRDNDAMREIGNLLVIVRTIEKRVNRMHIRPEARPAQMIHELQVIALAEHNTPKRKAIARKWAKRITRDLTKYERPL